MSKSREQRMQEIIEDKKKIGDGASDLEIAMRWVKEMETPCCDPRNPDINFGYKWYDEAKKALEKMKQKSKEYQNEGAVAMLEQGILEYEEKNGVK